MSIRDDIGSRGEAIFYVLMTQFCNREQPYFRPHHLGEKFPTLDYLVELIDTERPMFFFVQVKTTTLGYTADRHLKAQVSKEDLYRMALYPAPTYVVGIDEREETGYIVSANEAGSERRSSLPTAFPIDCANLKRLRDEVQSYWEQRHMQFDDSAFRRE